MTKLLNYLDANKKKSLLISWCFFFVVCSICLVLTVPFYRNIKVTFTPGAFESAEIKVKIKNREVTSQLISKELKSGEMILPGALLVSFKGRLNPKYTPKEEEEFKWSFYKIDNQFETFVATPSEKDSSVFEYTGPDVGIIAKGSPYILNYVTCLITAFILVTFFHALICSVHLIKKSYVGTIFFSITSCWMTYHLLANWPGIIGFDVALNNFDALDVKLSSFIQPFTTLLNSSFLNIYPHYVWTTLSTILAMCLTIAFMANYFIKDRISLLIFSSILLYFFYSPLNTFTNLFISRDGLFSWLFFAATLIPLILHLTQNKKSLIGHAIFLGLLVICIEIRKEVFPLLLAGMVWSYFNLSLSKKIKLSLYSSTLAFVFMTMFGLSSLRISNASPIYQSTIFLNPVADIISQKGLDVLTDEEKHDLAKVADVNNFAKDFSPHDINPYPFMALNFSMTKDDLLILTKLYFRLMKDYPILWFKNRIKVLIGSFGLNNLPPSYASDIRTWENGTPLEYYYTLHSMPVGENKLSYGKKMNWWKWKFWANRDELNFSRYAFNSFAIPLVILLFSLPFLIKAPLTAFALLLHLGRIVIIFPLLPASYIKYVYCHYLMFLFLPLFIYSEIALKRRANENPIGHHVLQM